MIFRNQLDVVKTPEQATAIEHEIQFSTAEADRLENDEFASLERTEAQEALLASQIRAQVETLAGALEKTQVRHRRLPGRKEFAAELDALNVQRDALRPPHRSSSGCIC